MNRGYKKLKRKQKIHSSPMAYLGLPSKSGLNVSNIPYFVNEDWEGDGIGMDDSISEGGVERKDEDSEWMVVEDKVMDGKWRVVWVGEVSSICWGVFITLI